MSQRFDLSLYGLCQLLKALDNLGGELNRLHRRKLELEREVANLAHVVAQGDFSPALRAASS